jgi:gamma-glutamyl-gamma-aminobutyrate hydrolase PuuD
MTTLYSAMYHEKDPFGLFDNVVHIARASEIKEKDSVLILWGGEDIGTSIYGEKPNKYCFGFKPSFRDMGEMKMIETALEMDIPIIGVCRGAQLLCCMAGGKLLQHIDGHGRSHRVTLHDEAEVEIICNSSHHQMMLPGDCDHKVLASSECTLGLGENDTVVMVERVNEVVYFPTLRGLGIQAHPEWENCPHEFVDYCTRKIQQYILK